ncbi:hypothetical protein H6P87_00719 [Rickettsia tillamookensis]|uniref:Uncharacterized protein n=1 Tax=Rickettsia tillamookensis TaxID=2761623 RepID=A0A9E6MIC1_9RICK|nr:hypothetical protein [Rickettsia tillamookensis]QQV75173.1 hypothetical protein H6P87_00719 [Rickettsia tillamookensis]
MNTKKNQESITIYTYNEQGKATITLGKVEIIQAFCSNNSLNSDELMLRDETAKKSNQNFDKHLHKSENLEAIELASISNTSSSEEYSNNDTSSQTKILTLEEESDCGTFDCMGKNNDFCCVII